MNKILKQTLKSPIYISVYLFVLFVIIFVIIYACFVYPLNNLSKYQSKKWIEELTNSLILGSTHPDELKALTNFNDNELSLLYFYHFFQTKTTIIWVLMNLHNKFSKRGSMMVYYHNFNTNGLTKETIEVDFSNFSTKKHGRKLFIQYLSNYRQEIDFEKNIQTLSVSIGEIKLNVKCLIDDYSTTVPSFMPGYKNINAFANTSVTETKSKNEWASDNPMIGKIIDGDLNGQQIEPDGAWWFDNFIGCNNFFVSEYYWFVILDNNWLIYLLWYNDYDKMNDATTAVPMFIKDRKNNKVIHCGPGTKMNFAFEATNKIVQPVNVSFKSNPNIKFGDIRYDDYNIVFSSNEIHIKISSIKGQSYKVLDYDYYGKDNNDAKDDWNKRYWNVLNNLTYCEYVNMVDVEIQYNNAVERFKSRQVVDAIIPKNKELPTRIR